MCEKMRRVEHGDMNGILVKQSHKDEYKAVKKYMDDCIERGRINCMYCESYKALGHIIGECKVLKGRAVYDGSCKMFMRRWVREGMDGY